MSFINPEDGKKVAKLLGAVVAVFGCAAWRVVGATSASTPSTPPTPVVETVSSGGSASTSDAKATANASSSEDATASSESRIEVPALISGVTPVDPFRKIADAAPTPSPTLPSAALPSGLSGRPLPSLPLPTVMTTATAAPAGGGVPLSVVPPTDAPAAIHITGIVAGPNATAVVEFGMDSRIVREGTRLPDGTIVVRIAQTSVTLRTGARERTLEVGE